MHSKVLYRSGLRPVGLWRRPVRTAARRPTRAAVLALLALTLLSGCGPVEPPVEPGSVVAGDEDGGRVIRLGDIDPDAPAKRIRNLQPLVDHMAQELREHGISRGEVVIARNIGEMAQLLNDGAVDFYLDSPYPALEMQRRAGTEILLRRWVKGAADYWSVFITAQESPVQSLADLEGSLLALQERYSTSGFVLPAGTLVERGFALRRVSGPEEGGLPGQVSYFFSRDEENTLEMVVTGRVPVGAISSQDWLELPDDLRARLRVVDETITMPRQLLSMRRDLEPELRDRVREALLRIARPDEEPASLGDPPSAWTWKFDPVSDQARADMELMARLTSLLELE